ncbi:MAG: hypothetical protein K0U98_03255 [Deltaproteobacteria bacterium]|nr:hypothetical protein [Deltaproteobacteria bacterium]
MNSVPASPSAPVASRGRRVVRLYPGFNALYYSFYLQGLEQAFGRGNLAWTTRSFPRFGHHCLAFEVDAGGQRPIRIYISASDGPGINPRGLEWCDVYAKANLALDLDEVLGPDAPPLELRSRLLAIGPSFPVRRWSPLAAAFRALKSFALCRGQVERVREHLANYRRQYKYRMPLSAYRPQEPESDYLFFASRLWQRNPTTNQFRANYIRACRSVADLHFEGGFVPRPKGEFPEYAPETIDRKYPTAEYFTKTQRSLLVFNTPAVSSCHGWKLAEFLALGKAIISTPLSRAMPAPLDHGKQVHFVDGSQEAIRGAVDKLCNDADYRRHLQTNARKYYLDHLAPQRVVLSTLSAGRKTVG